MNYPQLFDCSARAAVVATLLLCLAACGRSEGPAKAQAPKQDQVAEKAEPTEEEMRAAYVATVEAFNPVGGVKLETPDGGSKRVKIKVEAFRKVSCKPGVRGEFRCEAEVGISHPDSDVAEYTSIVSDRYGRDMSGRWSLNP